MKISDKDVHESAVIIRSDIGNARVFRDVRIVDCIFNDNTSIGDDTTIERCQFESNVIINRRSYVNDSKIGMFTYAGINTTINWSDIGRFCSIGRNVDIGGIDHDYRKLTSMLGNRIKQMISGDGKYVQHESNHGICKIGNDVWIAAGAQILNKVEIGDGAVIGAGAVVTHDVPPYAIVAGVPAKIIGYRCEERLREKLLDIKWWEWPIDAILSNYSYLMENDISDEAVDYLYSLKRDVLTGRGE